MPGEHPPCECDGPNRHCSRYGKMVGRKWEHCRGINVSPPTRGAYLDIYSGGATVDEPGMLAKGVNYVASHARHAVGLFREADEQTQKARLDTCLACEHLNVDGNCNLCGCPVEEKVKMGSSYCPATPQKWGRVSLPTVIETGKKCCGS